MKDLSEPANYVKIKISRNPKSKKSRKPNLHLQVLIRLIFLFGAEGKKNSLGTK